MENLLLFLELSGISRILKKKMPSFFWRGEITICEDITCFSDLEEEGGVEVEMLSVGISTFDFHELLVVTKLQI
jgi:hypothetical protein